MTAEERAEAVLDDTTPLPVLGHAELRAVCDTRERLVPLIAAAIRAAVEEERGACARVADDGLGNQEIAAAIRARGTSGGTPPR